MEKNRVRYGFGTTIMLFINIIIIIISIIILLKGMFGFWRQWFHRSHSFVSYGPSAVRYNDDDGVDDDDDDDGENDDSDDSDAGDGGDGDNDDDDDNDNVNLRAA